jgi:hypothetical protein
VEEAEQVEHNYSWTIIDGGCDRDPINNFTLGAVSPSTPWKGFYSVDLLHLVCMPVQSLTSGKADKIEMIKEDYRHVGGIACWALGVNFKTLQCIMVTQHVTKSGMKKKLSSKNW